ncbi:MAG: FAD-binding and (Fe-S)-binding domain-containing protein [Dehalococcoidia bacterium]
MAAALLPETEVETLEARLASTIRGEVRFDTGSRALYATDASNYRQVPIGVVVPRDLDDVVKTVRLCHEFGAPIVPRGGGTSLAGQACNVAVCIDFSKYVNRLVALNAEERYAIVEPGIVLDTLRDAAEEHGLTFGPDPATHDHCTLGGMLGNNSCGVHAVMAGRTADNVEALEILTYDGTRMWVGRTSDEEAVEHRKAGGRRGEIYQALEELRTSEAESIRKRFPHIPRRVSGYNLDELLPENDFNLARALVGSEGTCVIILQAKLRLVPSPPYRTLVALGYNDVFEAADDVPDIMKSGPIGLEGLDRELIRDMAVKHLHPKDVELLPDGDGWLLVEFGGDSEDEAVKRAETLVQSLQSREKPPSSHIFRDPEKEARIWEIRESGLAATAHVPGKPPTWPGWEDAAVAPEKLGSYLREFDKLLKEYGYDGDLYGHFGQGCVHTRITFDLGSRPGLEDYKRFLIDAARLVVRHGGSLSGEHGDGQARAELLPIMYGSEVTNAFVKFKSIWDPDWKMNPGKVVRPNAVDSELRVGPAFHPEVVKTVFSYPEDHDDFGKVALRCVGVGKCRRDEGGTMCPSYMATHEERDSTRGRARMLFEMLQGDVVTDGWRSKEVRESLDLCLACKGCKSDCPVNVDMASYKAEFLSHHYKWRLRPRAAYSMGLIFLGARLGMLAPRVSNFLTGSRITAPLAKFVGGIAPERAVPKFAPETFVHWFDRRPPRNELAPHVLLWPDTFTNFFQPDIAKAAVGVLEKAGFRVALPGTALCCGRPLYDWGMLSTARRLWDRTLDALREDIRDGTPIVGLEPSCVAAFRDELPNMMPNDTDAIRLSRQVVTLSEFLKDRVPNLFDGASPAGRALVQGHCHHKSAIGFEAEEWLMDQLGVEAEVPEPGCCGMAGSFGFERGKKYEVSQAVGERSLLPAARSWDEGGMLIADGFSCREQLSQGTGRMPRHIAQVAAEALGIDSDEGDSPRRGVGRTRMRNYALAFTGAAVAIAVQKRRRSNKR